MNKSFFTTALLSISFAAVIAQTPLSVAPRRADVSAAWPGCDPKMPDCTKSRLQDFIAANLQLPPEAEAAGAGGVVVMEFVVEKNGLIGEIGAMHDPGMGMVMEAKRVIELMKTRKMKWIPAEDGGKKIAFRYIVPVGFNLESPPKETKQEVVTTAVPADGIYDVVDVRPLYEGCEASTDTIDCTFKKMNMHIRANQKYPDEAVKLKVHGQVMVQFVIDTNGAVINPSILEGIGVGCDEEALRLVSTMPRFTPAMVGGVAVPYRMKLPVYFLLPKGTAD
jgi:TonB family protein